MSFFIFVSDNVRDKEQKCTILINNNPIEVEIGNKNTYESLSELSKKLSSEYSTESHQILPQLIQECNTKIWRTSLDELIEPRIPPLTGQEINLLKETMKSYRVIIVH